MCLPLTGRKSTTYLQNIFFFTSHQFLGKLYTVILHFSYMQNQKQPLKLKIKNSDLSLSSFHFSLFILSPISTLFFSHLYHHHVTTSLSFYRGQNGLRLNIFSSFLIVLLLLLFFFFFFVLSILRYAFIIYSNDLKLKDLQLLI